MKLDHIGFKEAVIGIFTALRLERNMKVHFVFMLIVIFAGITLNITVIEWLFILFAIGLVISIELINTAIEIITDQLFKERHIKAKQIKDISAGAVLVASVFAAIIGVIIFLPRMINFF